jgi:hypothetical protein
VERLFLEGRDVLRIRRIAINSETIRIIKLIKSYYNQINKKKRELAKEEKA